MTQFTTEAARALGGPEWLVARRVKAVGYDYPPDYAIRTMIFEPGARVTAEDCTTHHVFFPAGITVIEADGSPVRNERRAPVSGHPRCTPASRTPRQAVALVD